jgi:hypothetical protein
LTPILAVVMLVLILRVSGMLLELVVLVVY